MKISHVKHLNDLIEFRTTLTETIARLEENPATPPVPTSISLGVGDEVHTLYLFSDETREMMYDDAITALNKARDRISKELQDLGVAL